MSAGTIVIAGGILAGVILLCIVAVLCYCRLQVSLCHWVCQLKAGSVLEYELSSKRHGEGIKYEILFVQERINNYIAASQVKEFATEAF